MLCTLSAVSRVHIATSNLGISQRMFEMSIARARDRVTFGKPIIKRQAIRVKLANMQMMIHALRCTIIDFCDDFDLDNNGEYVSEKAAICKLFSIDTVRLVSDEMLEIFGGDRLLRGFSLWSYRTPLPRLPRYVA